MAKEKVVTKKDIEKALEVQAKTILKAVDFGFKNSNKKIDGVAGKVFGLDSELFGLKIELQEMKKRLDKTDKKIDEIHNKMDKFFVIFTKQEQENKIILMELKIIKGVLKQKLGIDIDELAFA
jgi:hypothetical protein